jgi:hypothetical protein
MAFSSNLKVIRNILPLTGRAKSSPDIKLPVQAGAKEIKNEKLKIKNDKRASLAGQIKTGPGLCTRALPAILYQ